MYKGPKQVTNKLGVQTDPAVLYRQIFGRSRFVSIEFVGVWDTVSSLGQLLSVYGHGARLISRGL